MTARINPYKADGVTVSGDAIRRARALRGMTQQELADHLHVSIRSVRHWETELHPPMGLNRRAIIGYITSTNRLIAQRNREMRGV